MDISSQPARTRPVTVAFLNCFDATTFGRTAHITRDEERRLGNVLAALHDFGFILKASFDPVMPTYGFPEVIEHLRATFGSPFADAALAAAERAVPALEPAPIAVMPVWEFEPDGGGEDVLLSSATLWNSNLLLEALRVTDDDDPTPVAAVQARFDRWTAAAGAVGRRLTTVRLPGRPGSYVLFAAPAAA